MPRDHFAQMSRQTSHRHDSEHDGEYFNEAVSHLCGMLYSVVTLKAFFPKSPAPITNSPVKDAASGDQKYTQLPLW